MLEFVVFCTILLLCKQFLNDITIFMFDGNTSNLYFDFLDFVIYALVVVFSFSQNIFLLVWVCTFFVICNTMYILHKQKQLYDFL